MYFLVFLLVSIISVSSFAEGVRHFTCTTEDRQRIEVSLRASARRIEVRTPDGSSIDGVATRSFWAARNVEIYHMDTHFPHGSIEAAGGITGPIVTRAVQLWVDRNSTTLSFNGSSIPCAEAQPGK